LNLRDVGLLASSEIVIARMLRRPRRPPPPLVSFGMALKHATSSLAFAGSFRPPTPRKNLNLPLVYGRKPLDLIVPKYNDSHSAVCGGGA
jgi:hypothetical protein